MANHAQESHKPKSIIVVKTYDELNAYLASFRDGDFNLVVLIGSWGVGKSQMVRESLGDKGCWIEGTSTPFGMYSLFYRYRNKPIVLDDIDSIYSDPHSVSLLKSICRTELTKRVAWNARNGFLEREGLPKQFTTTSPVMIICNEWKTLNKNVAALEDRAVIFRFEPGPREVHAQAGTWFKDREIYDWFEGQLDGIETHSFRYYVKAAQFKKGGHPWKLVFVPARNRDKREILVEELLQDGSFASQDDRIREFAKRRWMPLDVLPVPPQDPRPGRRPATLPPQAWPPPEGRSRSTSQADTRP